MERLTLNTLEQGRLRILNRVLQGQCSVAQAVELLALSERHVWRLLAAYRKEGAVALAHRNRGRKSERAVGEETKERVWELAQGTYAGLYLCQGSPVVLVAVGNNYSLDVGALYRVHDGVRL